MGANRSCIYRNGRKDNQVKPNAQHCTSGNAGEWLYLVLVKRETCEFREFVEFREIPTALVRYR